jgi:hypothetical protein
MLICGGGLARLVQQAWSAVDRRPVSQQVGAETTPCLHDSSWLWSLCAVVRQASSCASFHLLLILGAPTLRKECASTVLAVRGANV